jgi:hypothetical protein
MGKSLHGPLLVAILKLSRIGSQNEVVIYERDVVAWRHVTPGLGRLRPRGPSNGRQAHHKKASDHKHRSRILLVSMS